MRSLKKEIKEANPPHVAIKRNLNGTPYYPDQSLGFLRKKTLSKILKHPGELFFLPSEGKNVLANFINWNTKKNTMCKSITYIICFWWEWMLLVYDG